jgi:hypothetical protein
VPFSIFQNLFPFIEALPLFNGYSASLKSTIKTNMPRFSLVWKRQMHLNPANHTMFCMPNTLESSAMLQRP